jgi:hypothetical protein
MKDHITIDVETVLPFRRLARTRGLSLLHSLFPIDAED